MLREKLHELKGPALTGAVQAAVIIATYLFLPVPERYTGNGGASAGTNWFGVALVWFCAAVVIGALHYVLARRNGS